MHLIRWELNSKVSMMTFPMAESKINISTWLDGEVCETTLALWVPPAGWPFWLRDGPIKDRICPCVSQLLWTWFLTLPCITSHGQCLKNDLKMKHSLLKTFFFDVTQIQIISFQCGNSISLHLSLGTQTDLWPLSADLLQGLCVWGVTVSQQAHWERDIYHLKCLREGLVGFCMYHSAWQLSNALMVANR